MRISKIAIAIVSIASFASIIQTPTASAATEFQAGRIIDDAIFTNKSSMSAGQIQDFLNSKVPTCDTNGQQNSEFGGPDLNGDGRVQRWEWGKANYNQTTFPCLRDYKVGDGRSAAQVIYDTAQKYTINPQVLIVLLQKEQGLVTDTWPLDIQYRSATGYGCPDTAPCDAQYYGLVNQLDWAAKMFRSILDDSPYWYTPYELGDNYIQYNPNAECGGTVVNIQNRSTQALYNYTPYQPNAEAIAAPMGAVVSCGAYGNLNFYRYFTSWFGDAYVPFTNLLMPRWMQTKAATYEYDAYTGNATTTQIPAGTQQLYTTKITIGGVTYLRNKDSTSASLSTAVRIDDLEEIPYQAMASPRWLKLNRNAYKQTPRTGYNIDGLLQHGRAIKFESKTTIANTTYLRTAHDVATGQDKAIPAIFLEEVTFEPLLSERWMSVNKGVSFTDINSGSQQPPLQDNTQAYFSSKLLLNDILYLRTKEATDNGSSNVVNITDVTENSFIPMTIPRTMKISAPTEKYDTRTLTTVNYSLESGQQVRFKSKIYVNNQWYLRSETDTNSNIPYGIPLADLVDA